MINSLKKFSLTAGLLVILVSACNPSHQHVNTSHAPEDKPPESVKLTPTPPNAVPDGSGGNTDRAGKFEASHASPQEPISGTVPENIPDEKERNAMLDRVNLSGPVLSERNDEIGTGSTGKESRKGIK